jgi:dTDP-4-dehydrorhamnose reductase
MRLLIVGGSGMIGHRVWLSLRERAETWVTLRRPAGDAPWLSIFDPARTISGVSAEDPGSLDVALRASRPDVVINALGMIRQRPEAGEDGALFRANCLVPHYLADRCSALGARLIQISTDCVFRGDRGAYTEDDAPDGLDAYGLSKRLGEVDPPHLTLRTSAVGRSLAGQAGLVEWLIAQRGVVQGWRRAIFSGLATPELADTIAAVALEQPQLEGRWHVAAPPINKHELLTRLRDALALPVEIQPVDDPVIDRSLDDGRFRAATGIARPNWNGMIERVAREAATYPAWRGELGTEAPR